MNVLVDHRRTFSKYKIILRCISSSLAYFHDADRHAIKQILGPALELRQRRREDKAEQTPPGRT